MLRGDDVVVRGDEVAFNGVEDDGIASTFPSFLQYPSVDEIDCLLFFCCPVVRNV